ncbi:MAG: DNA alkylation repair protein [Anaerolineales bacterium]|nr:DNA alkylation repair protein [Anaerolineales bacterium]
MPAVNPARLKQEIESLAEALPDPAAFSRRVLSLAKFYADYTRRPGMATGVDDAPWVLNLPDPVRRELQRAIIHLVGDQREQVGAICTELWATGYREIQMLAASLLGRQSQDWVPAWAEERGPECMDRPALTALATEGLAGWRSANMPVYLAQVETWLQDKRSRMQVFALIALQELLDEEGDWLPAFFDILERYHWEPGGEARKVFLSLLQRAARHSRGEMAGFLLSLLNENPDKPAPYLSSLENYFPDRQVRLFRQALSG